MIYSRKIITDFVFNYLFYKVTLNQIFENFALHHTFQFPNYYFCNYLKFKYS